MSKDHRWLEIDARGMAFHERFLPEGVEPPAEVFYCDCNGVGRESWNPHVPLSVALTPEEQAVAPCQVCGKDRNDLDHKADGLVGHTYVPPVERVQTADEWKAEHAAAEDGCVVRRQIFVDVTDLKVRKAARGMAYDEKTATFSVPEGFVFNANDGAYVPAPIASARG
jgi:hypothetical protein